MAEPILSATREIRRPLPPVRYHGLVMFWRIEPEERAADGWSEQAGWSPPISRSVPPPPGITNRGRLPWERGPRGLAEMIVPQAPYLSHEEP
jgi:hypothetical protein